MRLTLAATTIAAWFFCSFTGNLLSGMIGTVWEKVTPQAFFLMMAGICAASGLLLLAIHRLHSRVPRVGVVAC